MVCRDLRLEEKCECVSTSMIQEQKFLMPTDVVYNTTKVSHAYWCCIQHMLLALKENE